jgi:hypothetical protein
MKILQLLPKTLARIAHHSLLCMEQDGVPKTILQVEAVMILLQLDHLFRHAQGRKSRKLSNEEVLRPFRDFLAARWKMIENIPQLHYNPTYHKLITEVCETLATELAAAEVFYELTSEGKQRLYHRYELLMPGMNPNNCSIGLNLNELDELSVPIADSKEEKPAAPASSKKIQLRDFIVDAKKQIILVSDTLEFASQDGVLRHTNEWKLEDNIQRGMPLDFTDETRIKYHSVEAFNVHCAIVKLLETNMNSQSAFGALNRLIDALYMGSIARRRHASAAAGPGDAKELVAGTDAIVGIQAFYIFFTNLSPADQQILLNMNSKENEKFTFRYFFYTMIAGIMTDYYGAFDNEFRKLVIHYLKQHLDTGIVDSICMKISADTLVQIKNLNKDALKKIFQKNDAGVAEVITKEVQDAEDAVNNANKLFFAALATNSLNHFSPGEIEKLGADKQAILLGDPESYTRELARKLTSKPRKLAKFLTLVPMLKKDLIINNVLGRHHLQTVIGSAASLAELLKYLGDQADTIGVVFSLLGPEYLKRIIASREEFELCEEANKTSTGLRPYLGYIFMESIMPSRRSLSDARSPLSGQSFFNKSVKKIKRLFSSVVTLKAPNEPEAVDNRPVLKRQRRLALESVAVPERAEDLDATQPLSPFEEGQYIDYPHQQAIRDTSDEPTQIIDDEYGTESDSPYQHLLPARRR